MLDKTLSGLVVREALRALGSLSKGSGVEGDLGRSIDSWFPLSNGRFKGLAHAIATRVDIK